MTKQRLDKSLVERKITRSRSQAKDLIEDRQVLVNGIPTETPASLVDRTDSISLVDPERADWVSRGGRKLQPLLEDGYLSVEDVICLDVGASTGGFTQALLKNGACHVHAVDAGEGQLAYELRQDNRVSVHEKYNFRYVEPDDFSPQPRVFVMDVSFIGSRKLVPSLNEVLPTVASGLVLIKPQFEADPEDNVQGIIRDRKVIRSVLGNVLTKWEARGWGAQKIRPSPIKGSSGNQEYFVKVIRGEDRRIRQDEINETVYRS